MTKKMLFVLFVPLAVSIWITARADEAPVCEQLAEKAVGYLARYSVYGEANGPLYFSGISCAIRHRNKTLCAMETVSFDSTARVYDFLTGNEIPASTAYYWVDEKNNGVQVLAFDGKDSVDKYLSEKKRGAVEDYKGLTDWLAK